MFHPRLFLAALAIFKLVASLPVEEKIEPVDLVHECIKVEGSEDNQDKSPILLIHGMGGSHKSWNSVNLLIASRTKRRVCTVDLRNHGDSPWNNRSDVAAFAVDIGHFLDKEGIKKVNFIGHSLGGKIAMHYTLNNPDRVHSVIVEDVRPNTLTQTAMFQLSSLFQLVKASLQATSTEMTEDEAKKSMVNFINMQLEQLGVTERLSNAEFEIKLDNGKWRFKHNVDVLEDSLKNPQKYLTVSSGVYEGPVLFIYGTKSPFKVNEDKENILKLFPKAELVPVEGAGHKIHGHFREFDDAVLKFYNKLK